jgi:hypothetical protein
VIVEELRASCIKAWVDSCCNQASSSTVGVDVSLLFSSKMGANAFVVSFLALATLVHGASQAHSAVKGTGSTTRGWSCCKNTCSWSGKAAVNNPVISCDNIDNLLGNAARRDGCESGGRIPSSLNA